MRVRSVRGALLLALAVFAGVDSAQPSEKHDVSSTERGVRYQRKVLAATRRTPVTAPPAPATTTSAPGPAAAPAPRTAPALRAVVEQTSAESARAPRSAAAAAQDRWMRFVREYASGANVGSNSLPNWPKGTLKVDLPVGGNNGGQSSVPVLLLPIPIPVYSNRQECSANQDQREGNRRSRPPVSPQRPTDEQRPRKPAYNEPRRPAAPDEEPRRPASYDEPHRPSYDEPRRPAYDEPRRPAYDEPRRFSYDEPRRSSYDEPRRPSQEEPRRPSPAPRRGPPARGDDYYDEPEPPRRPAPTPGPAYARRPDSFGYQEPVAAIPPPTMNDGRPVSSSVLVEVFRAQQPHAPQLPAVLVRDRRYADPDPAPAPAPAHAPAPAPQHAAVAAAPRDQYGPPPNTAPPPPPYSDPPRPRFDRPLAVRGELTVHRADYTEPYTAWWDPTTGDARVDLNDGVTSTYRMMKAGQVHRVAMSVDRTGDKDVPRCAVMRQRAAAAADRAPPMLPDMLPFSFGGFLEMGEVVAERWQHTAAGRAGEQGAARGEALTMRHELLLKRGHNDSAIPMMYTVSVDSSVLGSDCDRYQHRYREVHDHQPDAGLFHIDVDSACGSVEETDDMAVVEPLREFTMAQRDPRHVLMFQKYVSEFERQYVDSAEEAVRMNLFTQTSRFVAAGNRVGATFKMALNFLSDRLDAELSALLGVVLDDEHFPAEEFPHARGALRQLADRLPDQFDWRERGGVTPVRYQGSCSSCWAFAVAGAVEGALFRKTRRLVALSEQCLVDCAQPYGGRGCGGTWPSHAYDYVQDRGLPALDEYIPYQAKVLQCQDKRVPPVTQISAHVNVTQHSVPALKIAIRRHAPSVVIIDALLKSFQTYKSGVFYDDRCAKTKGKLKHAVLAVGWGEQKGEPHFILKNSWSAAWGDGGYIRVHGPSNTCGVLTLPSYPRLEQDDVLRDLSSKGAPAPAAAAAAAGRQADDEQDYD